MGATVMNFATTSSATESTSTSTWLDSFFPVALNEEETKEAEGDKGGDEKEDQTEEEGDEEEEEEEEEIEDPYPAIYEQCQNSSACESVRHHFEECQERVTGGKGFEGEDCVEEFFHLAHCALECAAPKLFAKLV